ncbi:MAG TPA: tRNA (adenosine(37)-N6)-threonylcarbamoyltransferase complex ATPase subunit type 1 TsaE [Ramlibacter sp.]|nr:tRNA (adenosine(37)-N6)-threonylcarbamoyltransferase complex ATPase subunit type 1 TsaE [Ramlibacter sp.]
MNLNATGSHPPIVGRPLPLHWANEDETLAFARKLAAHPAITHAFIELQGELGAGKTTFVRHLLRSLGVAGRIKSPTYAVVEPHEVAWPFAPAAGGDAQPGALAIWHFDFYRFNDPREWEDAGFRDVFASPGLKLAEWPEKAAGLLPEPDLVLHIEAGAQDNERDVTATACTALGAQLLS